jgi:tetratricopeptide (TPR) repeat protein
MKLSSGQIILLITAVLATAVIVFSNRQPSSSPEQAELVEQVVTEADVQIEKALGIINGGGQPMEGILMLKELADAEERNYDAVFLLGQLSIQSGQLEKAVERFTQVLEHNPDHIDATWELAMLNMKMGDLEDAIARFEYCIEKDESFVNGYFFVGQCLEAMGQKDRALNTYKTYLPLSPDSVVSVSVEAIINRLEVGATQGGGGNP